MAVNTPEQYLEAAVGALRGPAGWRSTLDALPVPVYTTDTEGAVTYWNEACVDFAGRVPKLGQDRWCVTWRLLTTSGEHLPHDKCPMAEAVKTRKDVRDKVAIAMRPDGSRRAFRAYPSPLFDADGNFNGAVNLLIDISDQQACALAEQSERCRRLAKTTNDARASKILFDMANDYSASVAALRSTGGPILKV